MEKIRWTDGVRNEVRYITKSQGGEDNPTYNKTEKSLTGLVISCVETDL